METDLIRLKQRRYKFQVNMAESYQVIAKRKQEQRQSRIPKQWILQSPPPRETLNVEDVPRTCGIMTDHELHITENYDATALAEAIASRKLKCVDVTTAFCKVSQTHLGQV